MKLEKYGKRINLRGLWPKKREYVKIPVLKPKTRNLRLKKWVV